MSTMEDLKRNDRTELEQPNSGTASLVPMVVADALRGASELAVAFAIDDMSVLKATDGVYELLAQDRGSLNGVLISDVLHRTAPGERASACVLLAAGDIDSFGALRHVHTSDGSKVRVHVSVRIVETEGLRFAVATIEPEDGDPHIGGHLLNGSRHEPSPQLTARQREILAHVVRGERTEDIAAATYLSTSTVRNHLSVIYKKFGVHSQAGLLALFLQNTSQHGDKTSCRNSGYLPSPSGA